MKLSTIFASLGLGAGAMYFYDPNRGARRRALVRDQVNSLVNQTDDAVDVAIRDLRNRTRGILAEAMARVDNEGSEDWIISERIRAELGRLVRHSRSIQVAVEGGRARLTGPVMADEVNELIRRVMSVRGVRSLDNQLQVLENMSDHPGLQGQPELQQFRATGSEANWSPSARLLGTLGGGLLTLYGMTRKGPMRQAYKLAGLGLAIRSIANTELKSLLGMDMSRDVIRIHKAINIAAPAEDLYQFWSDFENLPRFMTHLKEVKNLGNGRTHWVAVGPGGAEVEWDAVTTREIPNQEIAWESVAGSQVVTKGVVQFHPNAMGGSTVTVRMGYTPPAGVVGHAVASLMGVNPRQAMNEDLARLKSLFETGSVSSSGQELESTRRVEVYDKASQEGWQSE